MKSVASLDLGNENGNRVHEKNGRTRAKFFLISESFTLASAAQLLIIILGSIAFLYFARSIILPLLLAWIASMTLKPIVTWLHKFHLPCSLAAAFVLIVFTALVSAGVMWLGKPAVLWAKSAPDTLPQLKQKYQHFLQPVLRFTTAASDVTVQSSTKAAVPVTVKDDNHVVGTVFTWTGTFLAGIATALVLTFLLLAESDRLTKKVAHITPRQHKNRAVQITHEIQHGISSYLFTVTVINILLGAIVGTAFYFLGMPNAAMWGGVVALLNFLPFFGPPVGVVIVGLAGLLAFDSIGRALLPVVTYLTLHLLESYLLTPAALGHRFSLNRIIIFMTFIFCAWLWGVIGALLAMPLLVSIKVVCERVPRLHPAAEFISA